MKYTKHEVLLVSVLLSSVGALTFFWKSYYYRPVVGEKCSCSINFQSKTPSTSELLAELIARKAGARDPELVRLVKRLLISPPGGMTKFGRPPIRTPQAKAADEILKEMTNGFYIECGAYDGETASNTAWLGVHRRWSGLLLEIDPYYFQQVVGKRRNAWVINACLSMHPHATMKSYAESWAQTGQLIAGEVRNETTGIKNVPCFPLETLMLAINQSKVDFFSLDVEGSEMDVLQNIPLDRLDITVLAVEHNNIPGGKEGLRKYMDTKGYKVQQDIEYGDGVNQIWVHDFILVKK